MKLYEITHELAALIEDEALDEETFKTRLDALKLQFQIKIEQCARAVRMLEAEARAYRDEANRMLDKARRVENRVERLKEYMLCHMREVGAHKVKGSLLTVSIQKSPPSVRVLDPDRIPPGFKRYEERIDLKAILEHLEETGEIVEGVEVIRGEHLRIR